MAPRRRQQSEPPQPQTTKEPPNTATPANKVLITYNLAARDLQQTLEELSQVAIETVPESTAKVHLRRLTCETAEYRSALRDYLESFPEEEPDDALRVTARDLMFRLEEHLETFSATRQVSAVQPLQTHQPNVCKLPKLELLTFGGKLEEWALFWENFVSSVHSRKDLADDLKLQYLTSVLKDEARKVLGETLTASEYPEAVSRLQRRYGDRQQHIFHYMHQLVDVPEIKSTRPSLQAAHDGIHRSLAALRRFDLQGAALLDALLQHLVSRRFDNRPLQDWRRTHDPDQVEFSDLLEFMEMTARVYQKPDAVDATIADTKRPQKPETKSTKRGSDTLPQARTFPALSAAATSAPVQNQQNPPPSSAAPFQPRAPLSCPHCSQPHFFYRCPAYNSAPVTERKDIVRRLHLCLNCLRPGHRVAVCTLAKRCAKCGLAHHTSLHDGPEAQPNAPTGGQQQPSGNVRPSSNYSSSNNYNRNVNLPAPTAALPPVNSAVENPPRTQAPPQAQSSFNAPVSHSLSPTVTSPNGSFILLKTANAFIRDELGRLQLVRMFLDSGSQVSSMTEGCVERLHLRREVAHRTISGFAGLQSVQTHRVHCALYTKAGRLVTEFSPVLMPEIIPPLPTATVCINNGTWSYLQGLPLADPTFWQPRGVDGLLAARECALAQLEGLRRGLKGYPSAENSIFGWLLSGEAPLERRSEEVCAVALEDAVERLWRVEEISAPSSMSQNEITV